MSSQRFLSFLSATGVALALVLPGVSAMPAQVVNTVHSFNGNDGTDLGRASLTQGRDGNLYGVTGRGGSNALGTVFRVAPNGAFVVLYNFSGPDGSGPVGLTLARDGNFYGATNGGGIYGKGVLFKINSKGGLSVLYNFSGGADGGFPVAPPIEGVDGNLYGLTFGDFQTIYPTVYKFTSLGIFSTIYTFSDLSRVPNAPFLQAASGILFTTTFWGGVFNCGTIVAFSTTGELKWTHSFSCNRGGATPTDAPVQATDGNIYGTVGGGGNYNDGAVFELDASGKVTFPYSFGAIAHDGKGPVAGLVQGTDGNFYGATELGGTANAGSLFELTAGGTYSQLYSFPVLPASQYQAPMAALTQHTSGTFYGTTTSGGDFGDGSVYSLDMGLGPFITFAQSTGKVGRTAQILGQGLTGTTSVTFNGIAATSFKVLSDTYLTVVVPSGATAGPVVVTTPGGTLTSNKNFVVK